MIESFEDDDSCSGVCDGEINKYWFYRSINS